MIKDQDISLYFIVRNVKISILMYNINTTSGLASGLSLFYVLLSSLLWWTVVSEYHIKNKYFFGLILFGMIQLFYPSMKIVFTQKKTSEWPFIDEICCRAVCFTICYISGVRANWLLFAFYLMSHLYMCVTPSIWSL